MFLSQKNIQTHKFKYFLFVTFERDQSIDKIDRSDPLILTFLSV